jgi:cellobiose phosphorylase
MGKSTKIIPGERFRLWAQRRKVNPPENETADIMPLRAELFSAEQVRAHGKYLAGQHTLNMGRSRLNLLSRLAENENLLLEVHEELTKDVKSDGSISPAGEWLLDNFYLIEEQIRTAKRHFPKSYSRELPNLASGYPRVYDIALEIVSHGDGRVDPENLSIFVSAYQSQTTLSLGELWAIPIMLRLALMENLRRVASRIAAGRAFRKKAEHWADRMMEISVNDPTSLILEIADMARSDPPMVSSFVAELAHRLQRQIPALNLPLSWIEQRLSETGQTIEQLVRSENQQLAADQISISNSIGSLRFLGAMDWRTFVEKMSVVEDILSEDPAQAYCRMDFATRDSYRHVIERIARSSHHSEQEVAEFAVQLAREAVVLPNGDDRTAHVGYYLVDRGLQRLERLAHVRLSVTEYPAKLSKKFPLLSYLGTIFVLTILLSGAIVLKAFTDGLQGWILGLLGLLTVFIAINLAIALVNWVVTLFSSAKLLPRMDYSLGIPVETRTLVVIPTMLSSKGGIEDLVKALEVRFLANQDDNICFSLLTDYRDAAQATLEQDEPLLTLAAQGIAELNQKYGSQSGDKFFLFHRPRLYNPKEKTWMGYERKRGKLAALNGFLRGNAADSFSLIVGDTAALTGVKYIITLDTDTQLVRDSARHMIGTMAHPLNRPYYHEKKQRVTAGYGILQPRVAVSLPGANRSLYAKLGAGEPGIDPYTRTVSDVYQDLFAEGSFIGKGIYDVDAFEQALGNRFPENRILSHDLLEGCYARAGLLSDVQLYEEFPSTYSADVNRRYRWIRGDWQIARWILPRVPGKDNQPQKNPLTLLSRWKILDNLRRSLTAAAMVLMLVLGWIVFPDARFWSLLIPGILLFPALASSLLNLLRKPAEITIKEHWAAERKTAKRKLAEVGFNIACLPYEAFFSLEAVFRTTWRMLFSHRHLLEWNPSGEQRQDSGSGIKASYRVMWSAPFAVIAIVFILAFTNPDSLFWAAPILGVWFASPLISWWISRPLIKREAKLSPTQLLYLRKISRKTWAFFETFICEGDNWLPPDNFQEHPVEVVAHRTSPTNMGLAVLAGLAAFDFGYITAGQLVERTKRSLGTMMGLERYHGHFYNWYDTQTLNPLTPLYISSVDSGNLAGHLLTLQSGLWGLTDQCIIGTQYIAGLNDSLIVLMEAAAVKPEAKAKAQLDLLHRHLEAALESAPQTLGSLWAFLEQTRDLAQAVSLPHEPQAPAPEDLQNWWLQAFLGQCQGALDELKLLAPWIEYASGKTAVTEFPELNKVLTLRETIALEPELLPVLKQRINAASAQTDVYRLSELAELVQSAVKHAKSRIAAIEVLTLQCHSLSQMEYDFLYDKKRRLLSIGYNVGNHLMDSSFYDLLASEARLSSFVAIAQGKLPQETWFALGRLLTTAGGEPILLSWSGSMFEYLMPLLVMPTYADTLLDQTYSAAVARQIEHGKRRSVPWGISESGYNAFDVQLNYQYRAFGVPGLGLKRGLSADLVVAPYATALALMVAPEEACRNLERLSAEGFEARYGFYEAIDYTPSRLPRGESKVVIRSFMAHHQGMSLLSLAYLLLDRPMQKRFESDALFQATLLLLQERIPKATAFYARTSKLSENYLASGTTETPIRVFNSPDTPHPEVQLLSNGTYHVMVTNAGAGFTRWKNLAVTRWREDPTCDNWGTFCYIRDMESKKFWSATHQPTLRHSKFYEAIFSEGKAEFRGSALDYDYYTEIAVSPEDDIELRRLRITNRARSRRTIEITTYAEVSLASPAADALHPAFSNLNIQTEIIPHSRAILCTRRPRSQEDKDPWMLHLMAVHGTPVHGVSYETDRMKFIGRGNTVVNPQALALLPGVANNDLSNSQGSVLDPIVSIRCRITLDPEEAVTINMVTGVGETREAALSLIGKYQDRHLADRVSNLAWTHSQVFLRQFDVSEADAQLYGRLAGSIIYSNAALRADAAVLIKNHRGQSGLWGYAISGDLPIVLLQIEDPANISLVRQMVQAHAYWRLKGLAVDLVIWNEDHAGYRQLLHDQIIGLISAGLESDVTNQPGGIFVKPAELIAEEDRILIQSVARAIIKDSYGSLAEQIGGRRQQELNIPLLAPTRTIRSVPIPAAPLARTDLLFFNGLGGFTPDGREYVIITAPGQQTPAPWVNVLANPGFGTVISESGLSYTWSENAHEFRLTPWSNDPVSDSRGEAFYLRDEDTGVVWSPTPQPCMGHTPYTTRHGFGYSVFEHLENGIRSELWVYVALDAPIKFIRLKLHNEIDRPRKLSVTGYVEWVLGDLQPKTTMHIVTEIDHGSGAVFAKNPYNKEFPDRCAFFDTDETARTISCNRAEFLGRNGSLNNPLALKRQRLSGKAGTALDPCAAIQTNIELAPGEERELVFKLGVGLNDADARELLRRFRGPASREALDKVWQHWTHTLGTINVDTPDQSLNVLTNGWMLYQTLACRLWGRSATYQSGGAFGFRDQLQDVMALIHARPELVRQHILLCAEHQFPEGDVQHWWHPPTGRGVRTRCSDDYLWLPYVVSRYIHLTGDTGILDEDLHFLNGRLVNADEESYYDLPQKSENTASLYEHCLLAVQNGLRLGVHGLPLMGTGDWNDGMNLVGAQGKGESVWMGFFLYDILQKFAKIALLREDHATDDLCRRESAKLKLNLNLHGWDGEWFRRAYFDDGTPLGSSENSECRIDSIAQSWSVLSGAGEAQKSLQAMDSLGKYLVRKSDGIVKLLDPPFDKSPLNPGYIKGYVPGVRENGGQYTHAAIWASSAFAKQGDSKRAWELFDIINPVNHAKTAADAAIYKVEPYVTAADVYAVAPHTGRGGWTWYTGSSAWMYTLILESLLGLDSRENTLRFSPCLPSHWQGYKLHYRYRETVYHIEFIKDPEAGTEQFVSLDGLDQPDKSITLIDDRKEHWAIVRLPETRS